MSLLLLFPASGAGGSTIELAPTTGAVAVAGQTPTLLRALLPTTGTIAVTGYAPSVSQALTLSPSDGAITVTGQAPALTRQIAPSTGTAAILGAAPALAFVLAPGPGAASVNGQAPALVVALLPASGSIALEGFPPGIDLSTPINIDPEPGSITLEGYAPEVTSQRPILPVHGGTYRLTRSELMRRLRERAEELQAEADAVIAKAKAIAPEPPGTMVEDALLDLVAEEVAAAPDPELRVRELSAADMQAFRDLAVLADDEEVLLLLS